MPLPQFFYLFRRLEKPKDSARKNLKEPLRWKYITPNYTCLEHTGFIKGRNVFFLFQVLFPSNMFMIYLY
jgi:hypothetical protein